VAVPNTRSELLLESLYAGVLGGSAVAAFFLVGDFMDGHPLFTPSLMGSVIFYGADVEAVTQVETAAVVAYSIAHILAFSALGALISWLVHEVELHSRHPVLLLAVIFVMVEGAFFVVAPMAFPGVIERIGIERVGIANLLAAGTMGLFFILSHRAKAWQKIKHTSGELALDSVYAGVLGGSVSALFFLTIDLMNGQPFFTPSLMGSVLFYGIPAEDVTDVQVGAVIYYSIAHVLAFSLTGAVVAWLVHEVELHARHPFEVLLVLFAIVEVAFLVLTPLVLPGVIERLGIERIGAANLLAASAMGFFLVLSHRAGAAQKQEHTGADLLFDSFYSGAIGGSAVALFFLVADFASGQPFFTPSLMGSVLFLGVPANAVGDVRLAAVAYYSIAHMFSFALVGTGTSWLVQQVELHSEHPFVSLLVLFAIIEVGFFAAASVVLPGVVAELGVLRVGAANLLAAASMAVFFVLSHREGAWERLKQVAHLA